MYERQHDAWDTCICILLGLFVMIDSVAICVLFHSANNNGWLSSMWMTFCVLFDVKLAADLFNKSVSHRKVTRVLLGLLTLVTGCIAVYTLLCVFQAQASYCNFYMICKKFRYIAVLAATSATLYLSFLHSERKRHLQETEQNPKSEEPKAQNFLK